MNKKGNVVAITAAVAAYIEDEEKALGQAVTERRPAVDLNLWGAAGREEIMMMRMLWQRRIVSR